MKRKTFGRDRGLSLRMLATSGLLGLLYVVFFLILLQVTGAGIFVALVLVGALAIFQYYTSDKIALLASGAKVVDREQAPALHDMVERLCLQADLPKPKVAVIPTDVPNAFATGRNPKHAAIAVTTGLLEKMNRIELEGVVAHELSHIRHYDILVSTLAVTLVGTIALLTDIAIRTMWWNGGRVARQGDRQDSNNPLAVVGFVLLILAPIIAKAMQAAISRRRETLADVGACQLTRYPPGLIAALEKLKADTTVTHAASTATAHLWIEQPMSGVADGGRLGGIHRLFDTHPPLDERIALLREL
jgi:heat shock protein HtpX